MAKNNTDKTLDSRDVKKSKRNLRCKFTDPELLKIGQELAEKTTELNALELDKKRVTSDFGAKIKAASAEIMLLTNKIQTGYEFRMISCTEILGRPDPTKKTVIREDLEEIIGIEDLTAAEFQRELLTISPEPNPSAA